MSPSWPRAFRPAWRALVGWCAQTPVSPSSTGSSGRQPESGPGGARGRASVAPPPVLSPVEPAFAATTDSRGHSQRRVDAGHCAPALIATFPSPDREIVQLLIEAGLSIPDVAATLGVTPAAIHLAQQQAPSALQPAAAHGHPPATRGRVVLLPHARTEPPDTRRTGRVTGMNQTIPRDTIRPRVAAALA